MCFVLGLLLRSRPRLAKQGIKRVSGCRWNDGVRLTPLFQQHSEITSERGLALLVSVNNSERMKQQTRNMAVDCSELLLRGYKEILGYPTPSHKLKESGHNLSVSKNDRNHLLLLAQTTWAVLGHTVSGHWLLSEVLNPKCAKERPLARSQLTWAGLGGMHITHFEHLKKTEAL